MPETRTAGRAGAHHMDANSSSLSVAVLLTGELRLASHEHAAEWIRRLQHSHVYVATWSEYAELGAMLSGHAPQVLAVERDVNMTCSLSTTRAARSHSKWMNLQWKLLSLALIAFNASLRRHDILVRARTDLILPDEPALFANWLGRASQHASPAVHLANDVLFYASTPVFMDVLGDFHHACETLYTNTTPDCKVSSVVPRKQLVPRASELNGSRYYGEGERCRFRPRLCYGTGHLQGFLVGPSWRWPGSNEVRLMSSIALCYHILWRHNVTALPLPPRFKMVQCRPDRYNMSWGWKPRDSGCSNRA